MFTLLPPLHHGLCQAVERQAAAGVAEANSLLLVVDGQEGLTASDEEIISWLRRKHPDKPVTLAVNKCENVRLADTQVANLCLEPFQRMGYAYILQQRSDLQI